MNYFQDVRDGDSSCFPEIYTSVVHDQAYLITGNMAPRQSKPTLVIPESRFMRILTLEVDTTYHDASHTYSNLELNAIGLFVLPSDRHR